MSARRRQEAWRMWALERALLRGFPSAAESRRGKQSELAAAGERPGPGPRGCGEAGPEGRAGGAACWGC